MNRDFDYGHGVKRNQLETLERLGVLRLDYMGYVHEAVGRHWPGAEAFAAKNGRRPSPVSKSPVAKRAEKEGTASPARDAADDGQGLSPVSKSPVLKSPVAKSDERKGAVALAHDAANAIAAQPAKTGEAGTGRLRLPVAHGAAGTGRLRLPAAHGVAAASTLPQRAARPTAILPLDPDHLPRLADPYDEHADVNLRARSYLDANCAICHVLSGGGNALMDLGYNVPADRMQAIDERPQHESFGLAKPLLISPGQPSSSVLLLRMATRGRGQMPPLATSRVDERAVALIGEWIRRMKPSRARGEAVAAVVAANDRTGVVRVSERRDHVDLRPDRSTLETTRIR